MRTPLPQRRFTLTFDFIWQGAAYTCSIGCYPSGKIGEIFLAMTKASGTPLDVYARDLAVLISLGIQHGVPLETMYHATIKKSDGAPDGLAGAVLFQLIEEQRKLMEPVND